MSSKSKCLNRQGSWRWRAHCLRYLVGWGHTIADIRCLLILRCFSLRTKILRCRRPLREFPSCFYHRRATERAKQKMREERIACPPLAAGREGDDDDSSLVQTEDSHFFHFSWLLQHFRVRERKLQGRR